MRLRTILIAGVMSCSGTVLADSIDLNLNNDSIEATYTTNWRAAEFAVGALYNNDKNDWVASMGLLALGDRQNTAARSEAGLGGKLYLASVGNQELVALGLGGLFRIFPNNGSIGFGGYAFYAPDIVTAADGKKFWEAGARVEFEVVKKTANFYLGYRKVRADFNNGTRVSVDSGGHVGVRIIF